MSIVGSKKLIEHLTTLHYPDGYNEFKETDNSSIVNDIESPKSNKIYRQQTPWPKQISYNKNKTNALNDLELSSISKYDIKSMANIYRILPEENIQSENNENENNIEHKSVYEKLCIISLIFIFLGFIIYMCIWIIYVTDIANIHL